MLRRKLTDLAALRAAAVNEAETALQANNQADYDSAMQRVGNLNEEISRVQNLITEQERKIDLRQPSAAEARDMAEERGAQLLRGDAITFNAREIRRAINSVTIATGAIAEPAGAGSEIRDLPGNTVSSIVDQVYVQDLSGMSSFLEPYVIEEMNANGGVPKTVAGTARPATDPTFGVAEIKPYEVNVTSFVDRNIAKLSPADYFAKIHGMAMRSLRRKIAGLIINGDGAASPTFYGIVNAKNKAGANIFAEQSITQLDETALDKLYFAYGSDESLGGNSRLLLTKENLKAIGAIRGTNEKQRLFKIVPDTGNANTGTIVDGGVVIPYTLVSDVGASNLLYGDPINFELGLFGEYSVRVDSSVKAVERMDAILGDVLVGGNLIRHHGFVVGKISAG